MSPYPGSRLRHSAGRGVRIRPRSWDFSTFDTGSLVWERV